MKNLRKVVILFYLGVAAAFCGAQNITGGIVDQAGNTWTNAVVMAHLNNPSGQKPLNRLTLSPVATDLIQQSTNGNFNIIMTNTANIIPDGTSWVVSVCPVVAGQNCTVVTNLFHQASNLNISSRIVANLPPLVSAPSMLATLYQDSQVTNPVIGGCYISPSSILRCQTVTGFATVNALPISINTATIANPMLNFQVMKPSAAGTLLLPDCQLLNLAPMYAYVNLGAATMTVSAPNSEPIGGAGVITANNWALFQPQSPGGPGCSWQQF